MRKPLCVITVGIVLCGLILSGCSGKDDDASAAADEGLPAVSGKVGEAPKIEAGKGNPPTELTKRILAEGDGAEIKATDFLMVNYAGQLWDGKPFDSSFERDAPYAFMVSQGVIKGWTQGLTGVHVGDRVQLTVPPALAYAENSSEKIPANSTLVFVIDVLSAMDLTDTSALTKASATPKDIPGVKIEGNLGEKPTITLEAGAAAPDKELVEVLAEGTGDELGPDDYAALHYTGVIFGTEGTQSTYDHKIAIPTGTILSKQSEQLQKVLLGKKIGSRVAFVLPAQEADEAAGTKASSPSFTVVDIVAKVSSKG